ncbi:LacI family DNA-binding transcriptional regulator [Saccharibacillus sp. CPCC 101409]|uniref:LacI family DNA-binding transcriptional regulator n=1 Tax=Saccharibacillus sp. CPCC 101409 TaxID=3058041 RepID=UPI002673979E|nr:LacI family DNA-binding transcriptional regulator [Saccharibacillus sp. CPCC 101409]MDO3408898.1 LacI family DNA-binding transcriptional regulator [Saccharibacillus sp. CPCC 101409]
MNIRKIAELAGVSVSTVSRVLNRHPHVSESARSRVLQIIEETDYSPNLNAVQLKVGRTRVIGIVTPTLNHYYLQLIKGAANRGKGYGYQVLIHQTEEQPEQEMQALELLRRKKVDALMILRRATPWADIAGYLKYGPIVTCEPMQNGHVPAVFLDHYEGFRLGLEHLIRRGRCKIACVVGRGGSRNSKRRLDAYREVLENRGLPAREEWIFRDVYTAADGRRAADRLLALPERPDAVMTANDLVAAGLLAEIRERGLRAPEDLAVVGFESDESGIADIVGLTNVTNPLDAVGRKMFDTLYARLKESGHEAGKPSGGKSKTPAADSVKAVDGGSAETDEKSGASPALHFELRVRSST